MPEDTTIGPDLERFLEHLDDFTLTQENYQTLQDALEKSNGNIKVTVLEQLLSICIRDLKEDMKNPFQALNVINVFLKKIKTRSIHQVPNLVPSAIAILHIIKTTALFNKMEDLKTLCFELILSYPNDVLITLAVDHYIEIIEMLNLYCHQRIPITIRLQAINIVNKLLKILPPDKCTTFVTEGVEIWFSKVIPTVMTFASSTTAIKNTIPVETLEVLAEKLISVDYSNNPTWLVVLECIYTPHKYPTIMQNLLEAGNEAWYRLWIIFTKLLKNQITKNMSPYGSPINSMLPVVEAAFKMNVRNRCRAFQCWNALIDNFSIEANEPFINKRLKLLVIPLASNNAKVEETALAKFNTWWHLIMGFESKIKELPDMTLLPFLYFCFGKPSVGEKLVSAPGLLTSNTKRQALHAFANITGHINCDCAINLPVLKTKLLTSQLLVEHWKVWTNSLTMTIRICVSDDSDGVTQHFKCIWKSFITTIAELSDCNMRYNLFFELLKILQVLLQCLHFDKLSDLVFHIVTNSIFDNNDVVHPVFQLGSEENNTMHTIISILLSPSLDYVFSRYDTEEIINKLKPLAKFIAQKCLRQVIEQYLVLPLVKNNRLLLWTALCEAVCELKCETSVEVLSQMLLLPLKLMSLFTSVDISVAAWFALYNYSCSKLDETSIDKDICEMITDRATTVTSSKSFLFRVSLTVLRNRSQKNDKENLIFKCAETLQYATNDINYSVVGNDLIFLQETIISILSKLNKENDKNLAKTTILIISNILKITTKYFQQIEKDIDLPNFIVKLLEPLQLLFEQEVYSTLKSIIVDDLKKCQNCFKDSETNIHNIINNIIRQDRNDTASVKSDIVSDKKEKDTTTNPDNHNKFTEAQVKILPDKGKKKDSNIIDTVVENGEEFVVVNSNWRFNPKKLTDNQKEKFKRTREDIPALYQDLSQSQDEFKTVYRTNSSDLTAGSKSNTAESNVESSILKDMPCSNIVPRIIENILPESSKQNDQESTVSGTTKATSGIKQKLNDKSQKRPRMALKDRVFRNVKNLMEKSGLQKDVLNSTVNENLLLTPSKKQRVDKNLVNSAPPKVNAERPSRLKRKPKKLEDHKLSPLKKRRNSLNHNNFENIASEQNKPQNVKSVENEKKVVDDVSKVMDTSIDSRSQIENNGETISEQNVCIEEAYTIETVQADEKSIDIKDSIEDISKTIDSQEKTFNLSISDSSLTVENITSDTKTCDVKIKKTNMSPDTSNDKEDVTQKVTKKVGKRVSRIEKVLAIDMVEGHPYLKNQSTTRSTENTVESTIVTRKSMEKLSKSKIINTSRKTENKLKDKCKSNTTSAEKQNSSSEDLGTSQSQDIIESSQDSTLSTLSIKTKNLNKIPVVALENIKELHKVGKKLNPTNNAEQSLLLDTQDCVEVVKDTLTNQNADDIEFSRNKTKLEDKVDIDLTADMDTEPAVYDTSSGEVTEITDDNPILIINSDDTCEEKDTQETANADTQPQDPDLLLEDTKLTTPLQSAVTDSNCNNENDEIKIASVKLDASYSQVINDDTHCSPFKDDVQRKHDFMNSTLEISPIKTLSPLQEEQKSFSPETSNDFVVIKLSSPVQCNGEPYNNSNSPEIFTNDKLSPDKRDQSPPRNESVNNSSPSMSLKKNRPQVRSGRAAQMLVLCVPEGLPNIINSEKPDHEDNKRAMATNSSSRRNLRMLFNSNSEVKDYETCDNEEERSSFLKLKRPLPTADSSPSGPILKRKLNDIDDTTVSPASKRKRVSFQDPPVSTTICVKKYLEPNSIRSPQNSMLKRSERQARVPTNPKSPKRLDTVFNNVLRLENVLTKTVESFTEIDITSTSSEMSSLGQTVVGVVDITDLNDTDPICPALIDCMDPIDNITEQLATPDTKLPLLKEFEGKVATISDLAKLSQLEVERFCIKSPKFKVAKRVLNEYANKIEISKEELRKTENNQDQNTVIVIDDEKDEENLKVNKEIQTESKSLLASTQTDAVPTSSTDTQTVPSGDMTTCLMASLYKTPDFLGQLCEDLDESSKRAIANRLPVNCLTETLIGKIDISNSYDILTELLERHSKLVADDTVSAIQQYLYKTFSNRDLIKLCSDVLKNVSDRTT